MFTCPFCVIVLHCCFIKNVSKWSSEDVVKFLDVYEESEGFSNIRHPDYNNKMKRDSAMMKLMGKPLTRNVPVKSVEVLQRKIKSIKRRVPARVYKDCKVKVKVELELTIFINLNLYSLRGPIFS
jgi:hypothetical protein